MQRLIRIGEKLNQIFYSEHPDRSLDDLDWLSDLMFVCQIMEKEVIWKVKVVFESQPTHSKVSKQSSNEIRLRPAKLEKYYRRSFAAERHDGSYSKEKRIPKNVNI